MTDMAANVIMVVEDDTTIAEVAVEYLKEAGFEVESVADGKTAYEKISQERKYGLFILDIMLPGFSGMDLLKIIRSSVHYQNTPVIMFTALQDEYTQLTSFEGMADDYVTKPFSPKILVKRVEALMRRANGFNNLLQWGVIRVDLDGYEAYEGDERIFLTLKEMELLKVLMNNPKRVLSRQQLLDLVWGYDYFGDERIVDVHIKNLRKKFTTNIIATVKGVGYKLEPVG